MIHNFVNTLKMNHFKYSTHNISLYPYQEYILDNIQNHKKIFIKGARQTGITTTGLIYAVWKGLTIPNQNIIVIASNGLSSIQQLRTSTLELIGTVTDTCERVTSREIHFKNGSSILFKMPTIDCLRGTRSDVILLDCFAYLGNSLARDVWFNAVMSQDPTNGPQIIISTTGNIPKESLLCKELWDTPDDTWKKILVPWWLATYAENVNTIRNNIGKKQFESEYCDFDVQYDNIENSNIISKMWIFYNEHKVLTRKLTCL